MLLALIITHGGSCFSTIIVALSFIYQRLQVSKVLRTKCILFLPVRLQISLKHAHLSIYYTSFFRTTSQRSWSLATHALPQPDLRSRSSSSSGVSGTFFPSSAYFRKFIFLASFCVRAVTGITFLQLENFTRLMACSAFLTFFTLTMFHFFLWDSFHCFFLSTPPLVFLLNYDRPHSRHGGCVSTDLRWCRSGFLSPARTQMAWSYVKGFVAKQALSNYQWKASQIWIAPWTPAL